ncbi:MAG TPA: hypothetical protein VHR84_10315 [Terriglobales bacterium]|jgi:hypothetical protein|nr:hypothetical protein [Terriglobales bacterium]
MTLIVFEALRMTRAKLIYLEQILASSTRLLRSCLGKNPSGCVQHYSANDAAAERPIRRGSGELAQLAVEAKRTGVVQVAIKKRGLKGVRVAPE